jgi:sugar O-acyltransferase (sialic acid O-acetyltransferase NeuD family)
MNMFIYCAGGFGREIYDTALRANRARHCWDGIFFIDDFAPSGADFYGTQVFNLDALAGLDTRFAAESSVTVIANGEPVFRKMLYEKVKERNIRLGSVIDDSAIVSDSAQLGEGAIVTAFCSIASRASVGANVAVNTKSVVGHDVQIADHCVISSFVNLGGATTVGENTYIGMGAQIKEGCKIGKDVIIGMGSIVFNDIPDGVIALGNPARPMRPNVDKLVFKK